MISLTRTQQQIELDLIKGSILATEAARDLAETTGPTAVPPPIPYAILLLRLRQDLAVRQQALDYPAQSRPAQSDSALILPPPLSAAEQLKSLLTQIALSLVDTPEALLIEMHDLGEAVTLRVRAADSDIGKLIGSQGRTARSIRTCLLAAATKKGLRCTLEIVEDRPSTGGPPERAAAYTSRPPSRPA